MDEELKNAYEELKGLDADTFNSNDILNVVTNYAQAKAKKDLAERTYKNEIESFFNSNEGNKFIEDINSLRDIYEASKLEGASAKDKSEWITNRWAEQLAKANELGGEEFEHELFNTLMESMYTIQKKYPNLASSNDYVIAEDAEGPFYISKEDVKAQNKDPNIFPHTTGEYAQQYATNHTLGSEKAIPLKFHDLLEKAAESRGLSEWPSVPQTMNLGGEMLAPRSYRMYGDDEFASQNGGKFLAGVGDVAEFAMNFVPYTGLATKAARAGEFGNKAMKVANTATRLGEEFSPVSRAVARGAKGAVGGVVDNLVINTLGNAYDTAVGTDRGGWDSPEGHVIAGLGGGIGRFIGNSSSIAKQRPNMMAHLMGSEEGRELITERGWRVDPNNPKSKPDPRKIEDEYLNKYVNAMDTRRFAQDAFKDVPSSDVHMKEGMEFDGNERIAKENEAIDAENAESVRQTKMQNDDNRLANQELLDYYKFIDETNSDMNYKEWLEEINRRAELLANAKRIASNNKNPDYTNHTVIGEDETAGRLKSDTYYQEPYKTEPVQEVVKPRDVQYYEDNGIRYVINLEDGTIKPEGVGFKGGMKKGEKVYKGSDYKGFEAKETSAEDYWYKKLVEDRKKALDEVLVYKDDYVPTAPKKLPASQTLPTSLKPTIKPHKEYITKIDDDTPEWEEWVRGTTKDGTPRWKALKYSSAEELLKSPEAKEIQAALTDLLNKNRYWHRYEGNTERRIPVDEWKSQQNSYRPASKRDGSNDSDLIKGSQAGKARLMDAFEYWDETPELRELYEKANREFAIRSKFGDAIGAEIPTVAKGDRAEAIRVGRSVASHLLPSGSKIISSPYNLTDWSDRKNYTLKP